MNTEKAQAGAVAYIKQSTLDKLPGCKYIEAAVFPDAGEDRTPLYTTPPATVSVEALEGLVAELREMLNIEYHLCADKLTQLIKERSNGR